MINNERYKQDIVMYNTEWILVINYDINNSQGFRSQGLRSQGLRSQGLRSQGLRSQGLRCNFIVTLFCSLCSGFYKFMFI